MTGKGTFKLTFFNKNLPLLFLPLFEHHTNSRHEPRTAWRAGQVALEVLTEREVNIVSAPNTTGLCGDRPVWSSIQDAAHGRVRPQQKGHSRDAREHAGGGVSAGVRDLQGRAGLARAPLQEEGSRPHAAAASGKLARRCRRRAVRARRHGGCCAHRAGTRAMMCRAAAARAVATPRPCPCPAKRLC